MVKHRLQFDFTDEALKELDDLQSRAGFANRAELLRHALRFFQWALDETQKQGATIFLQKEDGLQEVTFPFWGGPTINISQPPSIQ